MLDRHFCAQRFPTGNSPREFQELGIRGDSVLGPGATICLITKVHTAHIRQIPCTGPLYPFSLCP